MPQNRYFVPSHLQNGSSIVVKDDEFHYLKNVMRTRLGETVEVINGQGYLAECELTKLLDKEAHLLVLETSHQEKRPYSIHLALGFLKPAHLEYAVEKCCEVGVDAFFLFPAARSEKKSVSDQYLKRLHTILLSSTKQCGRLYLPSLQVCQNIQASLQGKCFFGDLEAKRSIAEVTPNATMTIVIGPESGFTEDERNLMLKAGCEGVRLHPNTLRAETAAVVGSTLLGVVCAS